MYFDRCTVQGKYPDGDGALLLQLEEDIVQDPFLCPSVRSFVDAIPFAKALLIKLTPLHSRFHDEKDSFKKTTVVDCDIAALGGEIRFNRFILSIREVHALIVAASQLVSTGPKSP